MNDIVIKPESEYGSSFVPAEYLGAGRDEYAHRDARLGRPLEAYRKLKPFELEILVRNGNTCADWSRVLVTDPFTPDLVRDCDFAGLVRLGKLERFVLEHHEQRIPAGLSDSRIIDCDIGDDCAIHRSGYLSHMIIGNRCILVSNGEISTSNHAKFGNGVLKDGEGEDVRVWLDLMNEAGGRSILPFEGIRCADAYLWARYRDDLEFQRRLVELTDRSCDPSRGYYGEIGAGCVIKHNRVIKDVRVGDCAYIKGANKLKNLTIRSSDRERTQIGEGVELVNGIIGRGCRVFYGCKAVRFVMGDWSSLKYGARLIHSMLGDNSTVSCCELLNNLVFPAHEQHHNTSFLIASLVRGQSNMAAGATIGSNHNSRANDGEIQAGRGFWPGLCASVKHSSRFASYTLLAKGDYDHELDQPFPFSLVSNNVTDGRLEIMPAYWWMYDMYALMRSEAKFASRDARFVKDQHIEFAPLAPDTVEEIFRAMRLIEASAGDALMRSRGEDPGSLSGDDLATLGEGILSLPAADGFPLELTCPGVENSRRPVLLLKPREAYKAYRHMIRYYAVEHLMAWFEERPEASPQDAAELFAGERERDWENLGGQIVPELRVYRIIEGVKSGELGSWEAVHGAYDELEREYPLLKTRHAYRSLCDLSKKPSLDAADLSRELERFVETTLFVERETYASRKKDYDNPFRKATYRNEDEMRAVVGTPEGAKAVKEARHKMEGLRRRAEALIDRFGRR